MRILAIRGSNITSLAGEFEVRLGDGPLASAGLFSITGPTGAGKSSLLDVLCLALFNDAPRLEGQTKIGRPEDPEQERLTMQDARSLLRRGTSGGHAEVDYLGADERQYRARWEVRRARGRVDGKLQAATMTLVEIATSLRLGGTNTETLSAIEQTLGLDYKQFCRSALLAQGAFDAFLSAKGDERSALLEQMTSTHIYRQISKLAFERDKEESAKLGRLADSIETVPTLDAEARAALEASLGALTEARDRAAAQAAALEAATRWHADLAKLVGAEGEAQHQLRAAELESREAEALRLELADVERAAPVGPLLAAEREASARREAGEAALEGARAAAASSQETFTSATAALEAGRAAHAAAAAAREAAGPELERASKLDALIEARVGREASLAARLGEAERERAALTERVAAAGSTMEELSYVIADASASLAARAAIKPLEAQWERWSSELARYADAAELLTGLRVKYKSCDAESRLAQASLDAITLRAERLRQAAADAHAAWLASSDEAKRALPSEADRQERAGALEASRALEALVELGPRIARGEAGLEAERAAEREAALQAERARGAAEAAEVKLPLARAELGEARRTLDRVSATLSLEAQRARLIDGEPCPLCGSEAHPYAEGHAPAAALFDAQRARVEELDHRVRSLEQAVAEQRAKAEAAGRAREAAEARLRELSAESAALLTRWRELAAPAGAPAEPGEAAVEQSRARLSALVERLAAIAAAEARAAKLATETDRLYVAWQEAQARAAAITTEVADATNRVNEAREALERNKTEGVFARQDSERVLAELYPVFEADDGWEDRLRRDARAFAEARADEVRAYRAERDRHLAAEGSLAALRAERDKLGAALEVHARAAAEQAAALAEERRGLEADRATRAGLLEGETTEAARARLDHAVAEARARLDAATAALAVADRGRAEASERAARVAALAEEASAALARAEVGLSDALAALGADRAAAEAWLAHDPAWLTQTRASLQAIAEAHRNAAAVLAERARVRQAHEQAPTRPALAEAECAAELALAREALAQATAALATAGAELRRDDEARALVSARGDELERATQEAERWRVLRELIGASDGKKFCSFAQSLTLDALLACANDQLRDLAPRYNLMRVPGTEMDLQVVDRDMADEVRGVNSLSGGETFLVSLALALGLSSIAARNVRIDTLFIDEGFGTLDPETLDVALSALEALQATGRQVGVISHVRALADKIGAQVRVERMGAGRSRVLVEG